MRAVNQIKKLRYTCDWALNDNTSSIMYRLFTYNNLTWNIILRYHGLGGWTIRICNNCGDELYVFNSGFSKMSISLNDNIIGEFDGWYYEDIIELKNRLEKDLIILLKKYEGHIKN